MIKVYTGPMFAGKSTALLIEYNSVKDKSKVVCFKPAKDKRDKTKIRARNIKEQIDAYVIENFEDMLPYLKGKNYKYIIIDEVQFVKGDYNILTTLSFAMDIIIGGLSKTSELKPFGCMPNVLAIADKIILLTAKCECGKEAIYTYCKENKTEDILIGDKKYSPLCRDCFIKKTFIV